MGRSKAVGTIALGAASAAMIPGETSCRSPTEITVVVTTDFDCSDLKGVTVTAGALGDGLETMPPASTSGDCDGGRAGSVVVVPHGAEHASVAIKVVGGFGFKQAQDCAPAPGSAPPDYGAGCIVARRALDFTPHTPLTVPVVLEAACNGVPCDETQTCEHGTCVPASAGSGDAGAAAAACDTTGLQQGAACAMPGYCKSGSNRSPHAASPSTASRVLPGGDYALLVGLDGTVYATSAYGSQLAALDPATGKARWTMTGARQDIAAGAIASDGTIYVCGPDLYALDPSSGAVRWTFPAAAASTGCSLIVADDGTVYQSDGVTIAALDPGTHAARWSAQQSARAVALTADGTIVAMGYASALLLDPVAGATQQSIDTGVGQVRSVLAGPDGLVATGGPDGSETTTLYRTDGTTAWKSSHGGGIALGSDGTIYVVDLPEQGGSTVYALDPSSGVARWSTPLAANAEGGYGPLVDGDDDVLVVTYSPDHLYVVDGRSGAVLSDRPMPNTGAVDALAIASNGTVLVGVRNGGILAFGP